MAALALAAATAGTPLWAGEPTDALRRSADRVVGILEDPGVRLADKRAAVQGVVTQIFDVAEAGRRALGRHWQARSPAERREFVRLFGALLERAYLDRLHLYNGERVRFTGESIEGDRATVRAVVTTARGLELRAEARMLKRGTRWQVYDVAVAHVSLVANYRSQFDRIIRTASYAELLRRLRDKGRAAPGATPAPRGGPPPGGD